MDKDFSVDRIVELLVKERLGSLDPDQRAALDRWLSMDEANRAIYERLRNEDYLQQQHAIYKESDYPDGWKELRERMAESIRRRKRGRILRRVAAAASAAAVLAVAVMLFRAPQPPTVAHEDYSIQNVVPGRNDAVIELETGEKIILSEKQDHSTRMLSDVGTISGDSLVRYDATAAPEAERPVERHTFRVPRGATTKVLVLSDGTTVWLNAGSSITYPVRFTGQERTVAITGECYFDVPRSNGQPFVVETQDIRIKVMGTEFNVMSYAGDRNVETTLVSGRVSISASNKEVVLKPGVQAVYNKESSDISLKDVDTRIITAWKEGVFVFNNMTIENICQVLGRWYDIEFEFEDYRVRDMLFNGTLRRDKTLAFVLDRMKDTRTINYKMENGKVIIMRR